MGPADELPAQEVSAQLAQALVAAVPTAKAGDSLIRYVPYATAALLSDDVHRKDAFEASATLDMMQRRSVTALADAELAGLDASSTGDRQVRLSDGLYVERAVERRIISAVGTGPCRCLLIVGPAGHGKTSLLWHLAQSLSELDRLQPLFVKASALALSGAETGAIGVNEIRSAARAEERELVVLIDTLDLRLRSDAERDSAVELVQAVVDAGCWVIATSRPAEAAELRSLDADRFQLEPYSDDELAQAIERHVHRFYGPDVRADAESEVTRLQDAVANGLPLREVCESPLMLRMLFEVYAPHQVSTDVHSFALYDAYWERRVRDDVRIGAAHSRARAGDLSTLAQRVGLVLLAEGRPEAPETVVVAGLRRGGGEADLDALVSRGVLVRTEGHVRFFHQTFFEHAAGRACVAWGPRGLIELGNRAAQRPDDLFLAPVVEQALLTSPGVDGPTAREGETQLTRLLESSLSVPRASGIYVYCHLTSAPDGTAGLVGDLLGDRTSEIADYFVRLAPNMASDRLVELFEQLRIVWRTHPWRVRRQIVGLLERLASRTPASTKDFIGSVDVSSELVGHPASLDEVARWFARAVGAIVCAGVATPEWFWETLRPLWRDVRSDDVRVEIVRVVSEHAQTLAADAIASALFDGLGAPLTVGPRLRHELASLWVLEWRGAGVSGEQALVQVPHAVTRSVRASQLEGASQLLAAEPTASDLMARIGSWPVSLQREAATDLLGPLIAASAAEGGGPTPSRIAAMAAEAAVAQPHRPLHHAALLHAALMAAQLTPKDVAGLLDGRSGTDEPQVWHDHDRLGQLLVAAALGEHDGARAALQALARTPERGDKRVLTRVRRLLEEAVDHDELAATALLSLCIAEEDTLRLARHLPSVARSWPAVLAAHADALIALRQRLTAQEGEGRAAGYRLLKATVELGLEGVPAWSWLAHQLKQEAEARVIVHLLPALAVSVARHGPAEEAVQALLDVAQTDNRGVVVAALDGAAHVAVHRWRDVGLERVFDVVLHEPVTASRIALAGSALRALADDDIGAAASGVIELIDRSLSTSLSRRGQRDTGTRLRSTLRHLFAEGDEETRVALLSAASGRGEGYGRALIDAACRAHFSELAPVLDALLVDPNVDPYAIRLIRDSKRTRERISGNAGWPELYDLAPQ